MKHGNGKWTIYRWFSYSYLHWYGILHCHVWWHQRVSPIIFPWFSHCFPTICPFSYWFSYGYHIVFSPFLFFPIFSAGRSQSPWRKSSPQRPWSFQETSGLQQAPEGQSATPTGPWWGVSCGEKCTTIIISVYMYMYIYIYNYIYIYIYKGDLVGFNHHYHHYHHYI